MSLPVTPSIMSSMLTKPTIVRSMQLIIVPLMEQTTVQMTKILHALAESLKALIHSLLKLTPPLSWTISPMVVLNLPQKMPVFLPLPHSEMLILNVSQNHWLHCRRLDQQKQEKLLSLTLKEIFMPITISISSKKLMHALKTMLISNTWLLF